MPNPNNPVPKICGKCGKVFQCRTRESHGKCWCTLYPPYRPQEESGDCLCSDCLGLESLFPQGGKP